MLLTLKRIASRPDGTFGVLLAEDVPFALTLDGRNESHADTTVVQDYDDQAPTIATSAPSLGCRLHQRRAIQ
jgi:hypothetical protein